MATCVHTTAPTPHVAPRPMLAEDRTKRYAITQAHSDQQALTKRDAALAVVVVVHSSGNSSSSRWHTVSNRPWYALVASMTAQPFGIPHPPRPQPRRQIRAQSVTWLHSCLLGGSSMAPVRCNFLWPLISWLKRSASRYPSRCSAVECWTGIEQ